MPNEARQKKIKEKLNRAQKYSILGPQNLGWGGVAPRIRAWCANLFFAENCIKMKEFGLQGRTYP